MGQDFDEWGADRWPTFQPVRLWGAVMFVDPDFEGAPDRRPCYVEIHDERPVDGGAPRRVPTFCDIRQLGLTDSVRRAVLRRPRASARRKLGRSPGRMLITARDLETARQNGMGPQVAYTVVAVQPMILSPLPCTVMPGPEGTPLAGHRVCIVDPAYRHEEQPLGEGAVALKAALARALERKYGGQPPAP